MNKKSYRFIGGNNHNKFIEVEDGVRAFKTPWDSYTLRRIVMKDEVSKYEESCFVVTSYTDEDAVEVLREHVRLGRWTLRLPKNPEVLTQPLPIRESYVIAGLGWNNDKRILDVTFKSGETYRYSNVPFSVLGELLASESLGSAYGKLIRNRFPCTRLGVVEQEAPARSIQQARKGDLVECVRAVPCWLTVGRKYRVTRDLNANDTIIRVMGDPGCEGGFSIYAGYFKPHVIS